MYDALARLARRDGMSTSAKARDLLHKTLETHENLALAQIAADRERSLTRTSALTRDAVWRRMPRPEQPRR